MSEMKQQPTPEFKPAAFEVLIKVLEAEQANPTEGFIFDMADYGSKSACGTAACAMGTGVLRGVFETTPVWCVDNVGHVYLRNDFMTIGMEAFGINYDDYFELFSCHAAESRTLPEQIAYMKRFLARKQAA